MKIAVIGIGYVGLVTSSCFAESGFDVISMDINEEKINMLKDGQVPFYEPGLSEIVKRNYSNGRLEFTTDCKYAVENATIIFIAVDTPSNQEGNADVSQVLAVVNSIGEYINGYKIIVTKSTVPVGTGHKIKEVLRDVLSKRGETYNFDVVSNPEFLREGSSVYDFMNPERVIVGADNINENDNIKNIFKELYNKNNCSFVFTNIETSEIIKYACNSFLAVKVAFINEIANLSEAVGVNVKDVAVGMGLDSRIGGKYLNAGPGYGGNCLPKDTKALVHIGNEHGVDMSIIKTVIKSNNLQKNRIAKKIEMVLGGVCGKNIALLGLSFKADTDDLRESVAIVIINELIKKGAIVKVFDPVAISSAKKCLVDQENIYFARDEYDAIANADAIVIATEWKQFCEIDYIAAKNQLRRNVIFDLKNLLDKTKLLNIGYEYHGIGI